MTHRALAWEGSGSHHPTTPRPSSGTHPSRHTSSGNWCLPTIPQAPFQTPTWNWPVPSPTKTSWPVIPTSPKPPMPWSMTTWRQSIGCDGDLSLPQRPPPTYCAYMHCTSDTIGTQRPMTTSPARPMPWPTTALASGTSLTLPSLRILTSSIHRHMAGHSAAHPARQLPL